MVWSSRTSKSFRLFSLWGTLLVSVAGGGLAALGVALFWPSTHTAASSFFVSTRSEILTAVAPKTPTADGSAAEAVTPTQERLSAILGSRLLRGQMVRQHKLAELLRVDAAEAETLLAKMVQISAIGTEGFTITVTCKGYSRARAWFGKALRRDDARQLCAALANSYLTELQTYVNTTTVDEAKKKREFVQTALDQVDSKLHTADEELRRLQTQYELTDPAEKASLLTERIKSLEQARAEAEASEKQTQAQLVKAQGQLARTDAMAIAKVVQTRNPVISGLEQKLAEARVNLATQEAMGKTRQNREVAQLLTSIDATQKQMTQVSQDIRTEFSQQSNPLYDKLLASVVDLHIGLAGARARSAKTTALWQEARADIRQLPPVAQRYAALKQDQEVQLQTRQTLKQALAVALIQERQSKQAGEFLVLDKAAPPPDIYGPPIWIAGALVFVALLITFGLISVNRSIFGP